jgi:hypothetical protein
VNSRWTRAALAATVALACLAGSSACGKDKPAAGVVPTRPAPPTGQAAEQEATLLGREVFDLLDRITGYAAANQRKYPASLREAGIDSLSPKTARRIDTHVTPPMGFVMFRKPLGHLLTSCRGSTDLLEESALNDGRFTVTCTDSLGHSSPYQVQRAAGR